MREEYWLNPDGLRVGNGPIGRENPEGGHYYTAGLRKQLKARVVNAADLPDVDGGAVEGDNQGIPEGACVLTGYVKVLETFDSAGDTATLDIGLKESDGTEIDYDGLAAALAQGALVEGAVIELDGALVGTTISEHGYVALSRNAEAFTQGKAVIWLEWTAQPTEDTD